MPSMGEIMVDPTPKAAVGVVEGSGVAEGGRVWVALGDRVIVAVDRAVGSAWPMGPVGTPVETTGEGDGPQAEKTSATAMSSIR